MMAIEDALADIQAGATRTLAMICNHLIDQKILDRTLLIADLGQVQIALANSGVGHLGMAVPGALAAALKQSAGKQP